MEDGLSHKLGKSPFYFLVDNVSLGHLDALAVVIYGLLIAFP